MLDSMEDGQQRVSDKQFVCGGREEVWVGRWEIVWGVHVYV